MTIREGENAVLVIHCAIVGTSSQSVRWFIRSRVGPYAQYKRAVRVGYLKPRQRRVRSFVVVPDNLRFVTIERDRLVLYDSRADVACDMRKFNATLQLWAGGNQ
jgi:hypothetical protein